MPASNGGRSGGGSSKRKDNAMVENLRGACPPHKRKDLDKLVKSLNGDEAKIMEKIQEWWEEPAAPVEEWEDVNKKAAKKKPTHGVGGFRGGGRGRGPGRGRGNVRGGGGGGGRGGIRDERGGRASARGRGGPPQNRQGPPPKHKSDDPAGPEKSEEPTNGGAPAQSGVPVPVANAPVLKGAWGARAAAAAAPAPILAPAAPVTTSTEPPKKAPQPKPEDSAKPPEANPLEVGVVTHNDPTPSGSTAADSTPIMAPVARSGNVWATKGSAHLIRAEKPKPTPVAPPAAPPAPIVSSEPEPTPAPVPEPTLESGLPAGAWGKQPAPAPEVAAPIDIAPASPVAAKPISQPLPIVEQPVAVSPEPKAVPPPQSPAAPVNVLNMGHWETGDGDDQNLDFGFGSFGADNDATDGSKAAPTGAPTEAPAESASAAATAVSPARPPPGLSLGGMPPMPESAVMVHELENKMESAALSSAPKKDQPEDKPITPALPNPPRQTPQTSVPTPVLPSAGVTQQNYNQYGMPGMYNYNAAGSGFVGMTAAGPVIAGGVVPQQPGKPQAGGITQPSVPGQQGLYGSQPPPAPSSGNAVGADSTSNDSNNASAPAAAAGVPPGMPGAIPYANPALHYGQQHFYMGQPQGGIGYNYGYGQFGGVAQGGFGYQQVMGQNQGYGAPHYEDQSHQANSHHSGSSGGYQKNSGGGYRGRNNHHGNNQYQNQYNPQQHGGYGGQPYGMGYHAGEHFNQRAGYGGPGMGDPYAGMQQGSGNYQSGGIHSGGFQDDDHQKGKKGARGQGNSSLQQFQQQGPPQQLGGQQGFGLQGQQGSESAPSSGAAGGGWSNQGGGWSGGAPSWQGS